MDRYGTITVSVHVRPGSICRHQCDCKCFQMKGPYMDRYGTIIGGIHMVAGKSKEMARIIAASLEEKKARDMKILDISDVSVLADYFIIASGSNRNQVQAMADDLEEKLGQAGFTPRQVEGYQTANWILMDYQDIIIHIFDEENRLFYDLERIWRDGNLVEKVDLEA